MLQFDLETKMDKTHTYHELIKSCSQPGCPICQLVKKAVQGYLKSLFYENVNDPETRLELRQTLGFCYEHAWLLLDEEIGDALGTAIIYHDVVNFTIKHLTQAREDFLARQGRAAKLLPKWRTHDASLANALHPKKRCPVCSQRDMTTKLIMGVFTNSLTDNAFCQTLRTSPGLCLPHLGMAFEQVKDSRGYDNLLQISQEQLTNLRHELAEFIRKNDYRFRDEKIGAEGTAWRRVIGMIVGEKGK